MSNGARITDGRRARRLGESLREDLAPHGIGVSVLCPAAVKTEILRSGRNRPQRFGGPFRESEDHPLHDALKSGMEPDGIGAWVVAAIEDNAFYIFTHAETSDRVGKRHRRIEEAYEWAERFRSKGGPIGES